MTTTRTPGEWIVAQDTSNENKIVIDVKEYGICTMDSPLAKEDAAFICKAVNNHDKLVEFVKEISETGDHDHGDCYNTMRYLRDTAKSLRASLEEKQTA